MPAAHEPHPCSPKSCPHPSFFAKSRIAVGAHMASNVKIGIHLPQTGRASGPDAIRDAAILAEELGYADVWVSDHVILPAKRDYPPTAYIYDPLLTLTWAAAATSRIGLGTSVLVAPQHNPLWLAKALASLDALSRGRFTLALGVGWSEGEFRALDQPFHDRGARTDEIVDVLRRCWQDDPTSFSGEHYEFSDLRVLPKPAHGIPIWIGGSSEAAYRRGAERGDGFHAIGLTPHQARKLVDRLRRDRPESEFTISLRTGWDPQGMDPEQITREHTEFDQSGVQHMVAAPWRNEPGAFLRSMEMLAHLVGLKPG
jgi:probable F420-dependent oxidoreductase